MHSPSSAPIHNPYTGVVPDAEARVDLQRLMLELSPRARIRVDTWSAATRSWRHKYAWQKPWMRTDPTEPPRGPWAVVLTTEDGWFRWMAFDLDSKRGDVQVDLATLLRWLEEAGLTYVVAASGPDGGRHVWVTAAAPLDPTVVDAIHRQALRRLPTLDPSVMSNRSTGAVRPIGAVNRKGGRSELAAPASSVEAAALLTPATCGNDSEAFVRLAQVVAGEVAPDAVPPLRLVPDLDGAGYRRGADVVVDVLDDELGPRLPGTPQPVLDAATLRLLRARPPADRVSEDLASLLVRLAVRRWTWPMVERLAESTLHQERGFLHAFTQNHGGLRTVLAEDEAEARLRRQWARCVAYAATLHVTEETSEWTERIDAVVADVAAVQAAADACPQRWAGDSGPADRAALDLRCLLALRSGRMLTDCDVRRAAIATGHGSSTMHRAFNRLTLDHWFAAHDSEGPAGTHELLPVTAELHPVAQGGTQGTPPPPAPSRASLLDRLNVRLADAAHDLWAYGRPGTLGDYNGGLGHHAARTYGQLREAGRPLSVPEIASRTGYSARTVLRHLSRMQDLLVATRAVLTVHHECPTCEAAPGERCTVSGRLVPRRHKVLQHRTRQQLAATRAQTPHWRPRPGSLTTAAKAVGTHGVTASRARLYAAQVEVWHWWQRELQWMRTPKQGVRTGPQVHQDQAELVLTTLATQPHRSYPRDAAGRADHATAMHRITLRRIALR